MKKTALLFTLLTLLLLLRTDVYSANYYWVGNSGNWNDLGHWATTSGGTVFYGQIPTALDDVYFDANSFTLPNQVVTININPALCHNMDWSGSLNFPTLTGQPSNSIKIFGSLIFIDNMNLFYSGTFSFESSTTGNIVQSGNKEFFNDIYFNGYGGGWTLGGAFLTESCLYLNAGSLNTNNYPVTLGTFNSNVSTTRSLFLGSSIVTITEEVSNSFYANFKNFNFNCGTSTIIFNVNTSSYTGICADSANSDITFHNIEFSGNNEFDSIKNNTGYSFIFNNVTIAGNGNVSGNNIYNGTLTLTAGKTYNFQAGSTQTINGNLSAIGDCGNYISIQASGNNSNSNFNKLSGAVTLENVSLKNISAIGGALWSASTSIAIGNTNGFNITSPNNLGVNYYWVGGTGYWGDALHWSLTSGGIPNPAGCIPQATNNVFFDNNSFTTSNQVVTLNTTTAFCKDMNWTGALYAPKFAGTIYNTLKIYGSLTFISLMNVTFRGAVYFEATNAGEAIFTAGQIFTNKVFFDGIGGEWTLQDQFKCNSFVYLYNGSLLTNNMSISVGSFISNVNSSRTLWLGNSLFTVYSSSYSGFNIDFNNLNFDAGLSTIVFNSNSNSSPGIISSSSTVDITFYNIEFTGSTGTGYIMNNTGKKFIINNVSFAGNGCIQGNNTYNGIVSLSPGKIYTLPSSCTQTINGNFIANGSCGGYISLQSSINGHTAILKKINGVINISYSILKDISANGGATWNALNSTVISNSPGWVVTPTLNFNTDLYWIEGSGNWSDPLHWSLSSGGLPNASGCIPGTSNNVFFDGNSFSAPGQVVTIDSDPASCKNMTWSGVQYFPILSGSVTKTLKIYGSLALCNSMNMNFSGNVNFESTSNGNTITSGGQQFPGIINFNGVGGEWTLQDSLSSSNKVNLSNGSLITNNNNITAGSFYSNTSSARTLTLGSTIFKITKDGANACYINFVNLSFNAGTSTFCFANNIGAAGIYSTSAPSNITFYNIECSASSAKGYITNLTGRTFIFHNITFHGNARLEGKNVINSAVFYGPGIINGDNTFNDLTFSPGNGYIFKSGTTQTIHGHWWVQGLCTSYIILLSSVNGSPAYINKPSGAVLGYNLHIRDINCIGGANFRANNSVDLSDNSGWLFQTLPALSNIQSIIGPESICTGLTNYTFYTPSVTGAISYLWTVPLGASIISGQGDTLITINSSNALTGNITVNAFNGCSYSGESTKQIVVNQSPTAEAGQPQTICAGSSINLLASGGETYVWNTGDTAANIAVNPATTSTYFVTVSIQSTGCSNLDSVEVLVNALPLAEAGPDQTICYAESATLAANGGSSYSWNNGSIAQTIVVSPQSSTTYKITVTNAFCSAVDSVVVTVNPVPQASAGNDQTICLGQNATLTATGMGSYQWSNNATNQTINVSPGASTVYTVTVNLNGCTASDDVSITVNPLPFANAGANQSLCSGQTTTLFASGGTSYLWAPITGLSDPNIADPQASPASTTNYSVVVTNENGCSASDVVTINVTPYPIANAGNDTAICAGSYYTLHATGGTQYTWNNGNIRASYSIQPSSTITYTVTVNNNGCSASDDITITVNPLPQIMIASDIRSGCEPLAVNFSNNINQNGTYEWQFGDGNTSGISAANHIYNTPGTFDVSLTITGSDGCQATRSNSQMIIVYPRPHADFTWDPIIGNLLNSNINFSSNINIPVNSWSWNFGDSYSDNDTSNISDPSHNYVNAGTYNVSLYVENSFGCSDSAMHEITIKDMTIYYIPNAFTPDGDGLNDAFGPVFNNTVLEEFQFIIYDRWGGVIFSTNNIAQLWDGKQKDGQNLAPVGAYIWELSYKAEKERAKLERGTVTLLN